MFARPAAGLEDTERGREAQALLRRCVHCGFCLPACPTYRVTGNELDSPRGRIYLIKQLLEGAPVSAITRRHLDRCLTCRACERACPSGVEYGRLIDLGRELARERVPRSLPERVLRRSLVEFMSRPRLFGMALEMARAMRGLLPAGLSARIPPRASASALASAGHNGRSRRMVLLTGCVQPGLAPGINASAARVLDALGIGIERIAGEQCCGALAHHLDLSDRALDQARTNVDGCVAALDAGAEAIVSTASACGLMVKDYGRLLAGDASYAGKARRVSPRVAWQAPCTLQHGQRLAGRVEPLLAAAGCSLAATHEAALCCGSAGTYSILQPTLSRELRGRKVAALTTDHPGVIATANIGCLEHLRAVSPVPVRHWIEVVADVLDGPTAG
jgi:glycolate oxidase iron-sulfur subunit